jgi:integrase
LTASRPIKPTSPRCHSAWQPDPGRGSTYRCGKSVQTTGTTSVDPAKGIAYGKAKHIEGGQESVHPLHGPELRALRPLQGQSPYVFVTEAGTPVTTAWFLRMIQRTGKAAGLEFPIHPHMLRHSTGYKLANQGEDTRSLAHYLGHSTARYTALAPDRFKGFWKD